MPRQYVRSTSVRAPLSQNDQLSRAQIVSLASALRTATPDAQIDSQTFTDALLSQLNDYEGGQTWTDQAPPEPDASHPQVFNEAVVGPQDGTNLVFYSQYYFLPSTLTVCLNGVAIYAGDDADYTVAESGGAGTGYDTITLAAYATCAPLSRDRVRISYTRSGGPSPHVLA